MPDKKKKILGREYIFQLVLHTLVLLFYAIDRDSPTIELWEFIFFINLALSAFIINYLLLPKLFYTRKYLLFGIALILVLGVNLCIEEFVLEKIFFPDTRGSSFPGIFLTLLGILPVVTALVGIKFAWDAIRKQQELEVLKLAVKDSELQYLKTQINPHFLFNNLNNLYSYAIEKSSKTPEIILELSNVLRYMLYDCKSEYVPLSKELNQLKNFIRISEMQVEDRGEVRYSIGQIDQNYHIAPLILIVFIENAFKHSTASLSNGISVDVEIEMPSTGLLHFTCTNTYTEESNIDKLSGGIGLENVKKRLRLIYPDKHELKIEKSDKEFRVELLLNLN